MAHIARLPLVLLLTVAAATPQFTQPPLAGAERTKWFRDAKFGIFIHWGAYSVIGRHEWARDRLQIPQSEYDRYARRFNPVRFDADAWVSLASNAGAKYIVITSKHHDGFSIYRSRVSNYDMKLTPYDGDPLKLLAQAAARRNMRLGFYHSIMDWHHPDYRPRRAWESPTPNEGGNLDRYIDYMKEQLRELLTRYGQVAAIWFDGEWEHSTAEMRSDEIYDFIRQLQPNCLINDRLYKRQPGNRADFGTPEQYVPATGVTSADGKPVLWESCVTINTDSWGYNQYETEFKTTRELIRMLVEVVSKGGNLLLNVGPKPDGSIQDEFVTRLNAIGAWMKVNGEAIHETTASPFARLPFFGRATVKANKLYLHVFEWPRGGVLRVPNLKNLVHSARLMAVPGSHLTTKRDGDDVLVNLPAEAPDPVASVIELALDGAPVVGRFVNTADENGAIALGVESCEIETKFGQRAKLENILGHVFLTKWERPDDVPAWTMNIPKTGRYNVDLVYGSSRRGEGTVYTVSAGASQLSSKVERGSNSWVFKHHAVGEMQLGKGEQTLRVKVDTQNGVDAMTLEKVVLTPVK